MCWDIMANEYDVDITDGNSAIEQPEINLDEINAAAKLISESKRPMIMCGAGAQHASEEVLELATMLNAPVTALRSGRGVVAEDHPLGAGSVVARQLWDDTDLLIGIGSRLEMIYMRWGKTPTYQSKPDGGPKLIRIDINPDEMRIFQPDQGVIADSATGVRALINKLSGTITPNPDRIDDIAQAKARANKMIQKIQPQMAYWELIRDVMPRDGFVVPELSQMGFTSYYGYPVYEPRTFVTEGFQGTLGFGFQTALGVKVANPDKAVLSVTGDGGFMFGVQELSTAAAHDIGLVTLLFNNNAYGNVRRDQIMGFDGRIIASDLHNPDFVTLGESFGVAAYRVNSPATLKPVLEKAISENKPALIEIETEKGSETSPWEFIRMSECPTLEG
jgi:acetolactate synthase-1/2/3 large subunit